MACDYDSGGYDKRAFFFNLQRPVNLILTNWNREEKTATLFFKSITILQPVACVRHPLVIQKRHRKPHTLESSFQTTEKK